MRRALVVLLLVLVLPAAPAFARKGKGKGKHRHSEHSEQYAAAGVHVDVDVHVFSGRQREAYHDWYGKKHGRGHCPPGLARKGNGCLPPGLAKKRYRVGERCHEDWIRPVPDDLLVVLGPAPKGYLYASVDGDLLKLAVGSLLVVDAIDGLME
jgi:hypothetical protein